MALKYLNANIPAMLNRQEILPFLEQPETGFCLLMPMRNYREHCGRSWRKLLKTMFLITLRFPEKTLSLVNGLSIPVGGRTAW